MIINRKKGAGTKITEFFDSKKTKNSFLSRESDQKNPTNSKKKGKKRAKT